LGAFKGGDLGFDGLLGCLVYFVTCFFDSFFGYVDQLLGLIFDLNSFLFLTVFCGVLSSFLLDAFNFLLT